MKEFIQSLPKAELHVHLEGTLEPEQMFRLAHRNGVAMPYQSVEEIQKAYRFSNLQEFLDIYYLGTQVLLKVQDFYDLCYSYLKKLQLQGVSYAELMFDPQAHTSRGVALGTVVEGIVAAMKDAKDTWGLETKLIFSFLRHLPEQHAIRIWKEANPYKQHFIAVGLDSSELNNPPSKFQRVFDMARSEGKYTVAHAGEEGDAQYIREAVELLKVSRIDHGNNCLQDPLLVKELVEKQIPLTLCPLSNKALQVCPDLTQHPLKYMLDQGLLITINSDDPAYFGGHLNDNYLSIANSLNLTKEHLQTLAANSFKAAFREQ